MTGMEDVLAVHWPVYRWSPIYEANVWACSTGLCDVLGDFEKVIKHQAAELEAAGFGNLHDAYEVGFAKGFDSAADDTGAWSVITDFGEGDSANPYPAPKVSET